MNEVLDVVDLLGATFVYGPIGMVCGWVICEAVARLMGVDK